MKPENYEKFIQVVESNIAAGIMRGQQLFMEALEEDIEKDEVLSQVPVETVFEALLNDYVRRNQ